MLEDQVASLLQRYLGNYIRGLNKEDLKISVWNGDVALTNMQLKPEALNALKLPIKVKAGFLGSVKLKVPWSRLGQDPVLVYLDQIFLLAEPATMVEGGNEDTAALQEAKRIRIREMEMKLLHKVQDVQMEEVNQSWLGSLVSTIIGNLKLSISNVHIRYEDTESNPGHPFAAGVTLDKLSAFTVDNSGNETFATGGALDRIQKFVELERLALYFDSDVSPWHLDQSWENLLPSEWSQAFKFGTKNGAVAKTHVNKHSYILVPISGNAKYTKLRPDESPASSQPLQKAAVNLDDVTICLSKDGYRDVLKLADNFTAFNQRLKYAHYRPPVSVKSDPGSWWKYAYKVVSDQIKKASGKLSWEQVLKYARLRRKYIYLYASLLKSKPTQAVVDDNEEIEALDREIEIDLVVQWRMVAHRFVKQSLESNTRKQRENKSWWSFGWGGGVSSETDAETLPLNEEDWERLNKIIGYKEAGDGKFLDTGKDVIHTAFDIYMRRNASKLMDGNKCVAELSCENLRCSGSLNSESKTFDVKLGSYRLLSPHGLLAESAGAHDSLLGTFAYKPLNVNVDWSFSAKASPCHMTYLKISVDQILKFFESTALSHTLAVQTAAAVQVTIDEMKRSAQEQMSRALTDKTRFILDLDIAAPKITIPTEFCPDSSHPTKLMLDLGNLVIRTKDDHTSESLDDETVNLYVQFDVLLSEISAFLVDGDYRWSDASLSIHPASSKLSAAGLLPVIDKCGVVLRLQQIKVENPLHPSTRLAVRVPSLGFHFSPASYHRLMQVLKIFETDDDKDFEPLRLWNQADLEGWLSVLSWKGVANRDGFWQMRYVSLVGPFLYILENPTAKSYKRYISLRGKVLYKVPPEIVGDEDHVLAICDTTSSLSMAKVVEQANALVLRFDSDDSESVWHSRLQSAIYRASTSIPIAALSETSSDAEDSETGIPEPDDAVDITNTEKIFITGVLDELKICINYNQQDDLSFTKLLLSKEKPLFEIRATGGLVEIAIKENDMFIGTVLKSLEIQDLVCGGTHQRFYLARSFIQSAEETEGDEKYFEASDNLPETDLPNQSSGSFSQEVAAFKHTSCVKIPGLLPDGSFQSTRINLGQIGVLDSFVKAQIVIYDQNSPYYNKTDKMVVVTLATLSFFCRRPMIAAILEFVTGINVEEDSCESFSDISSEIAQPDIPDEGVDPLHSSTSEQPLVKGLLGKGKSRILFYLVLNLAHAQIVLLKEDETSLATFSQDNILSNIKVFPSSFSIEASVGNLRITDDSLSPQHMYFWACDMRNPGGSSFVQVLFSSYNADEEDDYEGYDYSLSGQLSEVRLVFLNRFVQEVASYFTGLAPSTSNGVVKLTDRVTNAEKWFTTSEIEGSPAMKLDLSLSKPIIVMPRSTDSLDYLKLDVVHITVHNTFQWFSGSKHEMNAVHVEILTVLIEDINLNVGTGEELGDSIIQKVNGLSIVIRRSLRDLLHQFPSIEATIEMDVLQAALSNREYLIITECAQSNISETPNIVPPLTWAKTSYADIIEPASTSSLVPHGSISNTGDDWISMKVTVAIKLAELSLHAGVARDAPLATVQLNKAWLLYKSTIAGESCLSVTLQSFNVLDERESTQEQFSLAIGQPKSFEYNPSHTEKDGDQQMFINNASKELGVTVVATMLIFDAKLSDQLSSVKLCVQRPQLLVALDFLLAVIEFFVPTVRGMLSSDNNDIPMNLVDAIILNESIYIQPSAEFLISPQKPLVVDDERFDHYIYDGQGGNLVLKDKHGSNISYSSTEPIVYVGNGKRLQFKNVHIKNGRFLDSCVTLGANSSYSVSEDDHVVLESGDEETSPDSTGNTEVAEHQTVSDKSSPKYIIEIQAISPELTFYNTSKDLGNSLILSNKVLHVQLDAFCRIVLDGETMEMTANTLGLTMESNGIRILEPFDTSVKFIRVGGKTSISLSASDIFMNFSFSILRLSLAVEEDLLAFLRMTREMTVSCAQFDKVAVIENHNSNQIFAFWRPCAPPGFAVLGDYLTPIDKPPTKTVRAVNTKLVKVKRPETFKLIWPPTASGSICDSELTIEISDTVQTDVSCSIWYPVAPKGYIALGCVVSSGRAPPPLSSAFCILASLVSSCPMRDCIMIEGSNASQPAMPFWRVDNCTGTFLPTDPTSKNLIGVPYDLRQIYFGASEQSKNVSSSHPHQVLSGQEHHVAEPLTVNSGRRFEAVASFTLVWWNQTSNPRKKLSIWRPVVPEGMVYFGDIAVKGYEPPNTSVVSEDIGDGLFKEPLDFQLVGKIKKQRGIEPVSFWLPIAPPGYVFLGCLASKGLSKNQNFNSFRCIRSDLVTANQFSEESIWDTDDSGLRTDPFSIWTVGDKFGNFLVQKGDKKPSKRLAVKLADVSVPDGPEDTVIDATIRTFSAACFDDFGGLMVPLFNVSLSGINISSRGRPDYLNSTVSFSLLARSYNDKYASWEPVVESVEGFFRYQYDLNSPGAASQLRFTSTKNLNVNISSSNVNMILQAYASWNSLNEVPDSYVEREAVSPFYKVSSVDNIHQKKNCYIIPQNKLGQEIFIRATEGRGLSRVIRMPSGDMKPLKVHVSQNMIESHLRGNLDQNIHTMLTLVVAEAQFQRLERVASCQYAVAIYLSSEPLLSDGTLVNSQSARTCGCNSEISTSSGIESVKWGEVFFFKVDSLDNYKVELVVTDVGKDDPVGTFSAPLKQIATFANSSDNAYGWCWIDLFLPKSKVVSCGQSFKAPLGRLKLAVLFPTKSEVDDIKKASVGSSKNGFIQISPTREGPWISVRLNYAAAAACWRLGDDVVASEVSVQDGNKYVNIRSLVSVRNETDFTLDLCLNTNSSSESMRLLNDSHKTDISKVTDERIEKVEFFEIEKYLPDSGWVCCSGKPSSGRSASGAPNKGCSGVECSSAWVWIDDWHLDEASVDSIEGWVYAPNQESLTWPESYAVGNRVNYARQRKWVRNRKETPNNSLQYVSIGLLKPGESIPLPLSCLTQAGYVLQLRPVNFGVTDEHAWSIVVGKSAEVQPSGKPREISEICVSDLNESEKLLYCAQIGETSSNFSHGMWFCLSTQAVEIAKDIRSEPIQDWSLVVKSPLSIINYLPLRVEYSVLEKQSSGPFSVRSRGILSPGKSVNVYSADITHALFLSLVPQKGWQPVQEVVPISHPSDMPSRTLNLKSSISGRIVQVILEQIHDKEEPMMPRAIRIYAPYWFAVSRCPPLKFRLIEGVQKKTGKVSFASKPRENNLGSCGEIAEDEFHEGYTIASFLNFNIVGIQASIANSGRDSFGPIEELLPLGDMDGSVDLSAYDSAGNSMRLFITSKPCPYQTIPTKVISIKPYMTFTNRFGQNIFIKLSNQDEAKVLKTEDSRVCYVYQETAEPDKLQVRLENTKWSFPIEITKEDTIYLVLRKENGERIFLRTEIRGHEEGSRFVVVFRQGSIMGPFRIENRTKSKTISISQCGFDDHWIQLTPLSTTNFSWEDPYGQKCLNVRACSDSITVTSTLNMETTDMCSLEGDTNVQFHMVDTGDIKVVRFTERLSSSLSSQGDGLEKMCGNLGGFHMRRKEQSTTSPLELTVEFAALGISVVDHRPRELSYVYLERVYLACSTGYDGGTTSRFKLILGHLQLDNQLPLTVMPVLLGPEQNDMHLPVFKIALTMQNENADGIQVYPYVYVRVTDKCWRLNIHEPIIWAVMDFYNNLQLDRLPQNQNVTQVDPEIRIDLIDVSEVRLKVSLETAPAQRPNGVLGVWSPVLSAVGSAFKIQMHLRKVIQRDKFMRRSSVIPAIQNRIWRDLVHNPLHLISSVDVLGMARFTLASLSKGFAELSTDGQFLQLRSNQVRTRKVTGVRDGIIQGTEALAQGFAFGVSGVVRQPVENTRQKGVLGLAPGVGRAFVGFIVQPVSGLFDFLSLTVGGVGASCARCFEMLNNRSVLQRVRNPRAIHSDGILREYNEIEAVGQMILWLAEATHDLGCTKIFKEPSKFAWTDYYENHFILPQQRIILVTNKRVMLLQCKAPQKMDKKPSKIMWDVPWEELLALELAKAGRPQPSYLILHLKTFDRSEEFARVIKCKPEDGEPLAVEICSAVRKMWRTYQSGMKSLTLKVPSSQRYVHFSMNEADRSHVHNQKRLSVMSKEPSSASLVSDVRRFVEHGTNFSKIWSSEQGPKSRWCKKKALADDEICSIWRPACPPEYVSVGDVACIGVQPPNTIALYHYNEQKFALPVGFDLVWRNCEEDYATPSSIWSARAPQGFVALGCVAVAGFDEPEPDIIYCVAESLVEEAEFETKKIWSEPDSYPWACHIYQVKSTALHFVALRQPVEESGYTPKKIVESSPSSEGSMT